jgi:hypothetical protein
MTGAPYVFVHKLQTLTSPSVQVEQFCQLPGIDTSKKSFQGKGDAMNIARGGEDDALLGRKFGATLVVAHGQFQTNRLI